MIIAFEGIDACGKETQVRMLQRYCAAKGIKTTKLDHPNYESDTGKKISELLRVPDEERDALVLQSLMTVNRYESQHLIYQAQLEGQITILDRYWMSGLVYGQTDGLSLDWLVKIHEQLIPPHQWIVLDISVGESFRRRPKREDEYEMNEKRLLEARQLYLSAQDIISDVAVINASQSPEEVHAAVLRCCEL